MQQSTGRQTGGRSWQIADVHVCSGYRRKVAGELLVTEISQLDLIQKQ